MAESGNSGNRIRERTKISNNGSRMPRENKQQIIYGQKIFSCDECYTKISQDYKIADFPIDIEGDDINANSKEACLCGLCGYIVKNLNNMNRLKIMEKKQTGNSYFPHGGKPRYFNNPPKNDSRNDSRNDFSRSDRPPLGPREKTILLKKPVPNKVDLPRREVKPDEIQISSTKGVYIYVNYAESLILNGTDPFTLNGTGSAISKAVSAVEILKRKYPEKYDYEITTKSIEVIKPRNKLDKDKSESQDDMETADDLVVAEVPEGSNQTKTDEKKDNKKYIPLITIKVTKKVN